MPISTSLDPAKNEARAPFDYTVSEMLNPEGPNLVGWVSKGVGAVVMGLLMALRTRFLWFRFHPIGFAIGPVWIMDYIWVTVFLAWALELSILRWAACGCTGRRGRSCSGLSWGSSRAMGVVGR